MFATDTRSPDCASGGTGFFVSEKPAIVLMAHKKNNQQFIFSHILSGCEHTCFLYCLF